MRINYNVSAMISNNALSQTDNALSKAIERLSSGLKINSAKDNPAGLAMAKRMNAQIEGISVATQNASDGVSIIETADGALTEVADMIQRMNELAVKGSNGTMSDTDRQTLQDEVTQLQNEIMRISDSTQFNSQKLLNGEFDLKCYTSNEAIKVKNCSDAVAVDKYTINQIDIIRDADGNITGATVDLGDGFPAGVDVSEVKDGKVVLKGDQGFEMTLDLNGLDVAEVTVTDLSIEATGLGPMRLQIGANEGQVLELRIPATNLENIGIDKLDMTTKEGCEDALGKMSDAVGYISGVRSRLGAYQNRLESSINSLDITNENMTASYSRIMDVDMAEEMTNYTTYQVLSQAGTSMLAQANERPSQVLQLLQ